MKDLLNVSVDAEWLSYILHQMEACREAGAVGQKRYNELRKCALITLEDLTPKHIPTWKAVGAPQNYVPDLQQVVQGGSITELFCLGARLHQTAVALETYSQLGGRRAARMYKRFAKSLTETLKCVPGAWLPTWKDARKRFLDGERAFKRFCDEAAASGQPVFPGIKDGQELG